MMGEGTNGVDHGELRIHAIRFWFDFNLNFLMMTDDFDLMVRWWTCKSRDVGHDSLLRLIL